MVVWGGGRVNDKISDVVGARACVGRGENLGPFGCGGRGSVQGDGREARCETRSTKNADRDG